MLIDMVMQKMVMQKIQTKIQPRVQTSAAAGTVALIGLLGTPSAHGQSLDPVASVHMVGGWSLVEVKDDADTVMGFWGIPRVEVEVGNIRRLWFEALPDGEWDVWAFEPVALHAKVDELVVDGASADSISFLMSQEYKAAETTSNLEIDGGVEGLVVKGFVDGDPLAEAAGALEDPDPMIDLLAGIGYPIAPGMTDLLVDGTAGANVGMNQATKELINCLRSTMRPCGGCVCYVQEGPMESTPWTVYQTNLMAGRIRCEYTRTETHYYWQWGFFPDDCLVCDEGSPEDPVIYYIIVEETDYWYDMEYCPPEPLGHDH